MIARALEKANWPLVKELSARTEALRRAVEGKRSFIETAMAVYPSFAISPRVDGHGRSDSLCTESVASAAAVSSSSRSSRRRPASGAQRPHCRTLDIEP
jgi:hypothetical protein